MAARCRSRRCCCCCVRVSGVTAPADLRVPWHRPSSSSPLLPDHGHDRGAILHHDSTRLSHPLEACTPQGRCSTDAIVSDVLTVRPHLSLSLCLQIERKQPQVAHALFNAISKVGCRHAGGAMQSEHQAICLRGRRRNRRVRGSCWSWW